MTKRIFHLADPNALKAARAAGDKHWTPAGYAAEGFIHLSYADQLAGTLQAHFAAVERIELIQIELREPTGLRCEESRGGALFPHLYRPLEWSEFAHSWILERGAEGWSLPPL